MHDLDELEQGQGNASAALLRRLQWMAPIPLLILAVLIYFLWESELSPLLAGCMVIIGVADFFIFKFLADRAER